MPMHTDVFLKKGNKIIMKNKMSVCEDYIIHGDSELGFKYVILSDGCSSSPQTDVGARLLVHTAKQYLQRTIKKVLEEENSHFHYYDLAYKVIHLADVSALSLLGLHPNSLDATLFILFECNNQLWFYGYGDGYVLFRNINGETGYYKITCENNAPNYLSYQLDPARSDALMAAVDPKGIQVEKTIMKEDRDSSYTESAYYGYNRTKPGLILKFELSEFTEVLIASDGIGSFDEELISDRQVIKDFTDFKNTNGEFIRRRVGRAFKLYDRKEYIHTDDIAIGGFTIKGEST